MSNNAKSLPTKIIGYVIGIIIAAPIGAIAFYWYNHVLHWRQFSYWQWFIIAIGWCVAATSFKPIRYIAGLVFVVCVLAQCLSIAGIITLPLIKPA